LELRLSLTSKPKKRENHEGPSRSEKTAKGAVMKKKIAIAVAVLGLVALVPTMAVAEGEVSICDIECGSLDCYVAQLFLC
jgi:hypothetical protein